MQVNNKLALFFCYTLMCVSFIHFCNVYRIVFRVAFIQNVWRSQRSCCVVVSLGCLVISIKTIRKLCDALNNNNNTHRRGSHLYVYEFPHLRMCTFLHWTKIIIIIYYVTVVEIKNSGINSGNLHIRFVEPSHQI